MPKSKSATMKSHGRKVEGYRGIGSGKDSYKTSTSKPAKIDGFPKGDGTRKGSGKSGSKY